MKSYRVQALPWERGWELHVEGVGVTQCATLDDAEQQVRDLVCTMEDVDECVGTVTITVADRPTARR